MERCRCSLVPIQDVRTLHLKSVLGVGHSARNMLPNVGGGGEWDGRIAVAVSANVAVLGGASQEEARYRGR